MITMIIRAEKIVSLITPMLLPIPAKINVTSPLGIMATPIAMQKVPEMTKVKRYSNLQSSVYSLFFALQIPYFMLIVMLIFLDKPGFAGVGQDTHIPVVAETSGFHLYV
jgi:hypothetical protein